MPEYGDIFDYPRTAMVFELINGAFIAAYGLAVVVLVALPKGRVFGRLRTN